MPDQAGREATPCRGYPDENALCTACGRDEDAHASGRETPHDLFLAPHATVVWSGGNGPPPTCPACKTPPARTTTLEDEVWDGLHDQPHP